jgi:hypothetical protein
VLSVLLGQQAFSYPRVTGQTPAKVLRLRAGQNRVGAQKP